MVYEDSSKDIKDSQDRFHTELLFSPGLYPCISFFPWAQYPRISFLGLYPCFQTEKERIYETRTKQKMQQQHSQNSNSLDGNNRTNLKIKNNSGDTSEVFSQIRKLLGASTSRYYRKIPLEMSTYRVISFPLTLIARFWMIKRNFHPLQLANVRMKMVQLRPQNCCATLV